MNAIFLWIYQVQRSPDPLSWDWVIRCRCVVSSEQYLSAGFVGSFVSHSFHQLPFSRDEFRNSCIVAAEPFTIRHFRSESNNNRRIIVQSRSNAARLARRMSRGDSQSQSLLASVTTRPLDDDLGAACCSTCSIHEIKYF